jgi:hypothetical protein
VAPKPQAPAVQGGSSGGRRAPRERLIALALKGGGQMIDA